MWKKFQAPGHKLRFKIWHSQDKINTPKNFFISQHGGPTNTFDNPTLYDSKTPLFDSMFHLCIENVKKENFFTEKLIDSLLCKTIPVYYGCPNIENYFNINGMIIIDNDKEAIQKINELTPEFYTSNVDIIEENYQNALKWIDYPDRLYKKINEIL